MYKKTTLDNGLRIVTHRMPGMKSAALGIWIKVGGRYEAAANKGISHYLEHLLFKGSKKYSCRGIKESIEGVGGSLNGFTSEELTCYLVKLPSRHLDMGLGILSDMVINPLLSAEDIAKERTVILEELKMYKDLPQSYVYELLDGLLWPGEPLGMSIIGTLESVNKIDKEALANFKAKYYTPLNIVISAAGLLHHDELITRVRSIFAKVKDTGVNSFVKAYEHQDKPQLNIFNKDTEQTHLALGFHAFKRDHPLRHALGLLHIILGANMSSRLFNEVREKRGLAYEIGTQVKRFHDTGAFIVHAGIDNNKVEDALGVILDELHKISSKSVSADEFKRAKEFYLGQLMLALEDTLDHMLWLGESSASLDRTHTLEDIIREVNKVTAQHLRQAAETMFKNASLNLALIGPLGSRETKIRSELHL